MSITLRPGLTVPASAIRTVTLQRDDPCALDVITPVTTFTLIFESSHKCFSKFKRLAAIVQEQS